LHIHLSGIEYGPKGEKNHLPVRESDLDLDALFRALHEFGCGGRILCESPAMEADALVMKEAWTKIGGAAGAPISRLTSISHQAQDDGPDRRARRRLAVRALLRASNESIQKLVLKKDAWIRRQQAEVKATYPPYVPKEFVDGEGFWYLGEIHQLKLEARSRPALVLNGTFRLARAALPKAPLVFERWYREQARQVFGQRVEWYAAQHGFNYDRVKVTSARQRWGSCSTRGTVSFAWRLVMAPLPVIDYVVVHELVHLHVKNHGRDFWRQVKVIMPDYEHRLEWLELNGHLLNLE
jgi:predicted metal-dependent hydrolase